MYLLCKRSVFFMKKIVISAMLVLSMILPTFAYAETQPIKVLVDGAQIEFVELPFIENGTTLVQFRPLFEKLGLSIQWDEQTKKIVGKKDGLDLTIQIDNKVATVNGIQIALEVAPRILNGNTVVPLRFVGESANKDVKWDQDNNQILISSKVEDNKQYDFRKVNWGTTKDQVKKSESLDITGEDETGIGYKGATVSSYKSGVMYEFANNKLIKGVYVINSPTLYVYNDLKEQLVKKYGNPNLDISDLYKKLYGDNYKFDFDKTGRLSNTVKWKTSNTEISLFIEGKSFEVTSLMVAYKDITYSDPKSDGMGL